MTPLRRRQAGARRGANELILLGVGAGQGGAIGTTGDVSLNLSVLVGAPVIGPQRQQITHNFALVHYSFPVLDKPGETSPVPGSGAS